MGEAPIRQQIWPLWGYGSNLSGAAKAGPLMASVTLCILERLIDGASRLAVLDVGSPQRARFLRQRGRTYSGITTG